MRLTNPLWYLAALLLAIGSAMAAAAVAASAFDSIKTAQVVPVTERADALGKTLAVYTDDLEPKRDVKCHARGTDKRRVEIDAKVPDIENRSDGTTWHLLSLLKEGRNGLKVVCAPRNTDIDDGAAYGYTIVDDYAGPANNGKGVAVMGLAVGVGLAAWVYWCRRERRREKKYLGAAADD